MGKERWIPASAGMTRKKGVMTIKKGAMTVSVSAMLLLWSGNVGAQCVMTQDCTALGYTKTEAECIGNNGIKCPFGDKWSCNCIPKCSNPICHAGTREYDLGEDDGCGGTCKTCVAYFLRTLRIGAPTLYCSYWSSTGTLITGLGTCKYRLECMRVVGGRVNSYLEYEKNIRGTCACNNVGTCTLPCNDDTSDASKKCALTGVIGPTYVYEYETRN